MAGAAHWRGIVLAGVLIASLGGVLIGTARQGSARQLRVSPRSQVGSQAGPQWGAIDSHNLPPQQVIVAVGDSITYGLHDTQRTGGWVTRLADRLTLDYPGVNYRVINAGLNGDTAAGVLKRVDHDVLVYHPQLVILSIGTNDFDEGVPAKDFRYILTRLIRRLLTADAPVLAVSILPRAGLTPQLLRAESGYNAIIAQVCAQTGTGYLDEFDRWLALGSAELKLLRDDVEHPNPIGYRLLAGGMAAFLETQYLSADGLIVEPDQRPTSDLIPSTGLAGEMAWQSVDVRTRPTTPISVTVTDANGRDTFFQGKTDQKGAFVIHDQLLP